MSQQRDLITGRLLPYCDDEYVRQAVEKLLLELGYERGEVAVGFGRLVEHRGRALRVSADLLVMHAGRPAMIIRCARGSLVSREQEALATARLLSDDAWLPLAVVTNGQDAELLDVATGRVMATGLAAIPGPERLGRLVAEAAPRRSTPAQREKALRIHDAYGFIQCPGQCTV